MTPRSNSRSLWIAIAAVSVLVVVVLYVVGQPREDRPLASDSRSDQGYLGLATFVRELDSQFTPSASVPSADQADVVLVSVDTFLTDGDRSDIESFAEGGGLVVVADPTSSLIFNEISEPFSTTDDPFAPGLVLDDFCDIRELRDVNEVEVVAGVLFDPLAETDGCLFNDDRSFIVAREIGDGTLVGVGSNLVFANGSLADNDNAVLAAVLLAPRPGTRVVYLDPWAPGVVRDTGAAQNWVDLVPNSFKVAAWQALVAFCVFALGMAIRFGKPVTEVLPVKLAGSRSVVATGNLLHTSRKHEQAAAVLQRDLLATTRTTLGLPADSPNDVVAAGLANRLGRPVAEMATVFSQPVTNDEQLVVLARRIDNIRNALLRVSHQSLQEA